MGITQVIKTIMLFGWLINRRKYSRISICANCYLDWLSNGFLLKIVNLTCSNLYFLKLAILEIQPIKFSPCFNIYLDEDWGATKIRHYWSFFVLHVAAIRLFVIAVLIFFFPSKLGSLKSSWEVSRNRKTGWVLHLFLVGT